MLPYASIKLRLILLQITIPLVFLLLIGLNVEVDCHGRLMNPPMRNSIWRFPEFAKYNPPTDYDDNQLYCGGFAVQYEKNGGKCGIWCGWMDMRMISELQMEQSTYTLVP